MRLTVDVNFLDAFNEKDHPRGAGGQFGTKLIESKHYLETHSVVGKMGSKKVPAKRYEVHHDGKHLGTVETTEVAGKPHKFGGRHLSSGKSSLGWHAKLPHVPGTYSEPMYGSHGSRESAVKSLKNRHGIKD